jgi:membrane-associated phospholipid phosphatase
MGTGNHYWLDVLAGFALALVAGLVLFRGHLFSRWRPVADA